MMMTFSRFIIVILLLGVAVYTVSYGIWTWKQKNKLGAIMIFLLALVIFVLPLYTFFIREA